MKTLKMKNKRADMGPLPTETIKILIAVLCIGVLAVLAYQLYGIFSNSTQTAKARASLDEVIAKVDFIKTQSIVDSASNKMILFNPVGWKLIYVENGKFKEESQEALNSYVFELISLDTCSQNCLCICPFKFSSSPSAEEGMGGGESSTTINCAEGVCKPNIDILINNDLKYGIEIYTKNLYFYKIGDKVEITSTQKAST